MEFQTISLQTLSAFVGFNVPQPEHESLVTHVHDPPHSSRPPECGWLTTCAYLESSGRVADMGTLHP